MWEDLNPRPLVLETCSRGTLTCTKGRHASSHLRKLAPTYRAAFHRLSASHGMEAAWGLSIARGRRGPRQPRPLSGCCRFEGGRGFPVGFQPGPTPGPVFSHGSFGSWGLRHVMIAQMP